MDKVFKALADTTRRQILDLLKDADGQTLGELQQQFPKLSRFAVMKHLKILEESGLISSRRTGRFKHHYLNTVPIQEISDRWMSRFAAHWSQGLIDLKQTIEEDEDVSDKPKHIYTIIIQTSVDALWQAITDPKITQHYFFNLRVESDWQAGSSIKYTNEENKIIIHGKIIECNPKARVVYSFNGSWEEESPSRVSFEIEPMGSNACKLFIVHDEFESETTTFTNVGNGWPTIISGLKTFLETGKPLHLETSAE